MKKQTFTIAAVLLAASLAAPASAQQYPERPIKMIVPWAAGGDTDNIFRPLAPLLQKHIEPLKKSIEWGPLVPFNITGQMNLHPRAAIQFRASPDKDDFVKFFDQVASDA